MRLVCAWMLAALCSRALALDPALDVNQYAHTAWRVREGFFKDSIGCIAQTTDGYLWLGTQFGLIRFDGVRPVSWQPPPGQRLPSNYVRGLLAARDGRLWISTWLGLASWKDGKLIQHPEFGIQSSGKLLEDRDGTVWAGTRFPPPGRVCAFRNEVVQCYGESGQFGDRAGSVYEDQRGNLWVGAQTGLWRWRPGPPRRYPFPEIESSQAVVETENSVLLVATRRGLQQLMDERAVPYQLPVRGLRFEPSRLLRDRDGSLWIGTFDRGLVHVHQGRMDVFSQSDGLSGNYIRDLLEDREGSIWVATDNGLDRFRPVAVATVSVAQGLSHTTPWSLLAARDGSVWVGTLDGLDRFKNGHIIVYRKHGSRPRHNSDEILSNLPDDLIQSLFEDHRQRIWVSTRAGLAYFDGRQFIPVKGVGGGVHAIVEDTTGDIWISEDHGLVHVRAERIVEQISWTKLKRKVPAIPMLGDPASGGLWLGFRDGTGVAYFKDGLVGTSYSASEGLGRGMVGGLEVDADGTLWVATEGGLSRVRHGQVHTLTAKNGLPCDEVHWVIESNDHSFWLYTACSLARVARSELDAWAAEAEKDSKTEKRVEAIVFDNSDGVRVHASPGGYTPQAGKSPDGKIWFLPWDGVSVLDPRRVPVNKLPPPVHIEQIIADEKVYWQNLSGGPASNVRLLPLTRHLQIDYTALSLVAPEKIRFKYKLEGYDGSWQDVGNRRQAFYTNLSPRQYRFRLMACNNSGLWNETEASLDFFIAPAYYQTTWFRLLCGAVVIAIIWAAYGLRISILERHQREIRALNQQLLNAQEVEAMRIAAELHDGVLQQIASLGLKLSAVKRQIPPDSTTDAKISELQKGIIQVATEVRDLSHELHPAVLKHVGLPVALKAYCDEFSKLRGIPVSCDADATIADLNPGGALGMYRIAQEALGNVAKHSAAGHVEVRLSRLNGYVCLSVSDDGVGCTPNRSDKSGGLGIVNMRERVRRLNGTFEFDSGPGRGTRVKATIPFQVAS